MVRSMLLNMNFTTMLSADQVRDAVPEAVGRGVRSGVAEHMAIAEAGVDTEALAVGEGVAGNVGLVVQEGDGDTRKCCLDLFGHDVMMFDRYVKCGCMSHAKETVNIGSAPYFETFSTPTRANGSSKCGAVCC